MKNKNTFLIALILVIVAITACFVFAGGLRGESAYQIAVKNGYRGSETDWLLSLQGKDGKTVDYYAMYEQSIERGEITSTTTFLEFIQSITQSGSADQMVYSIQKSLLSSVCVDVFDNHNGSSSAGAGVVYDLQDDGTMYVITNYHVTWTSHPLESSYYVTLYSDNYLYSESGKTEKIKTKGIEMSYVGGSLNHDIAVLKSTTTAAKQKVKDAKNAGALIKAEFEDPTKDLAVGTSCYTVGNPMSDGMSVSDGIVSVAYETIYVNKIGPSTNVAMRGIRTSCDINGGNSGGALYSSAGKVIGIINSKQDYSDGDDIDGISFAIPLSVAINVTKAAIEQNDDPSFVNLGLTYATKSCTVRYDESTRMVVSTEEAYVASISTTSPLLLSGLQANDVITSFSIERGTETTNVQMNHYYTLSDYALTLKIGDTLKINYERGEVHGTATITIA